MTQTSFPVRWTTKYGNEYEATKSGSWITVRMYDDYSGGWYLTRKMRTSQWAEFSRIHIQER